MWFTLTKFAARTLATGNSAPERVGWQAVSTLSGVVSALIARKAVGAVWSKVGSGEEPPLNPADRQVSWVDAAQWAIASGIGAAVARLVAHRAAATAWESALGTAPPGVQTEGSPA